MSPEIQRLFEVACELPAAHRESYLESHTDDPAVMREVLSLLAHDALAEPFFASALGSAASTVRPPIDLAPGTRIGVFTIVRMVGRGGMGTVYLAARSDGSFEQNVAIKVIDSSRSAALLPARFQQERQILARLNHPNIAHLLDGGEMPSGLSYFVMEFVPGQEIHTYCDQRSLNLETRLRLFLPVASAVQHAHQHLVVHRDLKPSNILVAEDGTPKLLDFGIAKVLAPGAEDNASTRLMTLEYASPEQVRGSAITTAADIYSLGAVLYRLLTGRAPHNVEGLSPLDAARRIAEQPVARAADLPAEVAAILEKALHKDPSHRYRSAADLSDDIQRFLDGKPVLVAPDSALYRASKFLRRHWIPVAALASVLLALAGGTGLSLWQARKAERRFAEVRQLSNRFMFEFEESIHNLPGATKARQLVVKTAQEYLDRLAAEGGSNFWGRPDRELTRELAEAYRKLGDVQGNTVESNAGDSKAALASYRKALTLRDALGDATASDTKTRVSYLATVVLVANAEASAGDAAFALQLNEKAAGLGASWIHERPNDADLLNGAANAYSQLAGRQLARGTYTAAAGNSRRCLDLRQRALALRPNDPKLQRAVAVSYWSVAASELVAGHPAEAVAAFATTVDLLKRIAAADPGNAQARRELLGASWLLANSMHDLLLKQKKPADASLPLWQDASKTGNQLLKDDPDNALVEQDVLLISLGLADTLETLHQPGAALDVLTPVIARQQIRYELNPENRTAGSHLALLQVEFADCSRDLMKLSAALQSARAALKTLDSLLKAEPGNVDYQFERIEALRTLGKIVAAQGDYSAARLAFRQGLESAKRLPEGPSRYASTAVIAEIEAADSQVASKMGEKKVSPTR